MFDIFNIIMPVFILMLVGYAAVKSGYLNPDIADYLNALTVKIAVPILLFRAIYNLDFSKALQLPILISFYSGAIISFILAIIAARLFFNRKPGGAVAAGFCAMFSNTVLLGIPITQRAFGLETLTLALGIIAFHAPSLYAIGLVTMEFSRRDGRGFGATILAAIKSIFANSLMIGILIGAFFNQLNIKLPTALEASVDMIANAAIPLALIGIGTAITRYQIKSQLAETISICFITLIIHPAIVFFLTYHLLELPLDFVRAATIIAAMPPGMNIYLFALMYERAVALSASVIVIGTSLSIFTISGWLLLLTSL